MSRSLPQLPSPATEGRPEVVWACRRTALVAGVFCATVVGAMILTWWQERKAHPLVEMQIPAMKAELINKPADDGLKQRIREQDQRVRGWYFGRRAFVVRGGYLLLGGAAVMLGALKLAGRYAPVSVDLPARRQDPWRASGVVRQGVSLAGLAVAGFFLALLMLPRLDIPGPVTVAREGGGDMPGPATSAVASASSVLPTAEEWAANWPGFRGPDGVGTVKATPPGEWDGASGKNILWKTEIPLPGHSMPVVWGKRVFLSGATAEDRAVFCFDADSGELLWQQNVSTQAKAAPEVFEDTGFAAPTMASDGQRVFVLFATGDLVAFDFSGKEIWSKFLGLPDSTYGFASSPLVWRDRLIVQFDQGQSEESAHSFLLAFDTATGKELWKTGRPVRASWTSPIVARGGMQDQIITAADPYAIGYDPQTGKELWRAKVLHGDTAPSPAYANGLAFVTVENSDLSAIRTNGSGDVSESHVAWHIGERTPDIISPLASGQFVLVTMSDGWISCYEPAKGELLWEQELNVACKASPILVGDRVYQLDNEGTMHVFRPMPKFELAGTHKLGEEAVATPAFVGPKIFIRGKTNLWCIGEKP